MPSGSSGKKFQIFHQFNTYGKFGDWTEIPKNLKFSKKSEILGFEKFRENYFNFFCLIKWKKEIRNIYANITGKNINVKSVKGLKYALTADENLTAENAEGVRYALITGKNINAKIVEGLKYAPITDKKLTAKSVKGLKYALTAGKSKPARSALIRLK